MLVVSVDFELVSVSMLEDDMIARIKEHLRVTLEHVNAAGRVNGDGRVNDSGVSTLVDGQVISHIRSVSTASSVAFKDKLDMNGTIASRSAKGYDPLNDNAAEILEMCLVHSRRVVGGVEIMNGDVDDENPVEVHEEMSIDRFS
jgi:hypothetical protein